MSIGFGDPKVCVGERLVEPVFLGVMSAVTMDAGEQVLQALTFAEERMTEIRGRGDGAVLVHPSIDPSARVFDRLVFDPANLIEQGLGHVGSASRRMLGV